MTLRAPLPEDVPRLAELRAARRPGHEEAVEWATRAVTRTRDEREPYRVWVAVEDANVVAYGIAAEFVPPPDAPANVAPHGHYLIGLMVDGAYRHRGLGTLLVRARLDWIAARAGRAFYFSDDDNTASIALHARAGFVPVTRDFWFPGLRNPDAAMTLYSLSLPNG